MSVSPMPPGYHTATPYITVRHADEAMAFYEKAFQAESRGQLCMPDGTVMHGEFQIGDSFIMYSEENPQMGAVGPETLGGTCVTLCLYVEDVDKTYAQAIASGATSVRPVEDQFWGDRAGTVQDPFGHRWTLLTHIEDVPWDEMTRRFEKMLVETE
mgnify:CR=1 FL=1